MRVERSQKDTPKQVADTEEDQDDNRHDQRHEADHRQETRVIAVVVHSIEARRRPAGASRSATR